VKQVPQHVEMIAAAVGSATRRFEKRRFDVTLLTRLDEVSAFRPGDAAPGRSNHVIKLNGEGRAFPTEVCRAP
jgi:hypothetical protein